MKNFFLIIAVISIAAFLGWNWPSQDRPLKNRVLIRVTPDLWQSLKKVHQDTNKLTLPSYKDIFP